MYKNSSFVGTFSREPHAYFLRDEGHIVSRDMYRSKKKRNRISMVSKKNLSFWTLIFLHPGCVVPLPIIIVDRGEISLGRSLELPRLSPSPTDINHTLPQKRGWIIGEESRGADKIASFERTGLHRMPTKLSCKGNSHRVLSPLVPLNRSMRDRRTKTAVDVKSSLYGPRRLIDRIYVFLYWQTRSSFRWSDDEGEARCDRKLDELVGRRKFLQRDTLTRILFSCPPHNGLAWKTFWLIARL